MRNILLHYSGFSLLASCNSRLTSALNREIRTGFSRNKFAPASIDRVLNSYSVAAVIAMMGTRALSDETRNAEITSYPGLSGNRISTTIRSGFVAFATAKPSFPVSAVAEDSPADRRISAKSFA